MKDERLKPQKLLAEYYDKKHYPSVIDWRIWGIGFFFNIKKIEYCIFSRRIGRRGTRMFGYSVILKVFGKFIL